MSQLTFDFSVNDYNDYNDYNEYNNCKDYKDYNDYIDYNDYSDYNDYRDSDLDLDWERFSDIVTELTITDKLRSLNYDIEG